MAFFYVFRTARMLAGPVRVSQSSAIGDRGKRQMRFVRNGPLDGLPGRYCSDVLPLCLLPLLGDSQSGKADGYSPAQ